MKYSKTIKSVLRGGLFLLTLLCQNTALAQDHDLPPMDSVEISLLTCQPHDEVYSLYGHTAIRYHEFTKGGIDAAFNYGVFNYDAPFFVVRFVFGLTDYELGAYPTQLFQKEYRQFGSMVTEQVLNLTNDEKQSIATITSITTALRRRATSSSSISEARCNIQDARIIRRHTGRWFTT